MPESVVDRGSKIARISLLYLGLMASVFIAIFFIAEASKNSPLFIPAIIVFITAILINAACDFFIINKFPLAHSVISVITNFCTVMFFIWISGGASSKYWIVTIPIIISEAFNVKTEHYFLIIAGFMLGLFGITYIDLAGHFSKPAILDIIVKLAAIAFISTWMKNVVNLLDEEIASKTVELVEKNTKGQKLLANVIKTIYTAMESKDVQVRNHSHRVIEYSLQIADAMRMDPAEKEKLRMAGLLHDIGKMRISDMILKKSEKLTQSEYEIIKKHPIDALNILESIDEFKNILIHIKYHHERWDGKGYPEGLRGETIPKIARILAVANAYDAMTSDRVYQKKMSNKEAREEIKKHKGTQFDPKLVDVFVKTLEEEDSPARKGKK